MSSANQTSSRRSAWPNGWAVVALAVAVALGLVGCATDDGPTPTGTWQLVEGVGPEGEVPLVDGYPVTLEVNGEEWRGTAACNTYGATVETRGDEVEITELFATEMACPEEGVMASEAAYLAALRDVDELEVDDRNLHLRGSASDLTFIRTETSA